MKRAGAEALNFTAKPAKEIWAALIFGKDRTAVKDAADQLAAKWLGAPEDAFNTARFALAANTTQPGRTV